MLRSNVYEVAFERYLREQQTAYVAVDETRRATLAEGSLKSLDFIVYAPDSPKLLVDVKGRRRFPGRNWENWATVDDIHGLTRWQQIFGADFRSLLVFAYEISPENEGEQADSVVSCQANRYAFYGVWLEDYCRWMKPRSPSWQTVWVPAREFQACRFPLGDLLAPEAADLVRCSA